MSRRIEVLTTFHVERDEKEIVLDVKGYVDLGYPGRYSGHPDEWVPPEGAAVCLDYIRLDGKPWDGFLTGKEMDELEDMLINEAANDEPWADSERDYDDYEID